MGGMVMPALNAPGRARAERRTAVILYAELRNFTGMSEMLEPAKVLQLASEFFALGARAVAARGGELLTIYNDTFVAAYATGAPAQIAPRAVQAAQDIQREFAALAERWQPEYGLQSAVALGLHLGDAVFGMAGAPGADQYVAFGDAVSVAERLVHRARAGEFVLSHAVMEALAGAAASLGAEALPPLELGRRPPIPIYGVLLDTRLDFT